jgi:WG containing repeat
MKASISVLLFLSIFQVYGKVKTVKIDKELTAFYKDGKWGAINKTGDTIMLPKYDGIRSVGEGLYTATEYMSDYSLNTGVPRYAYKGRYRLYNKYGLVNKASYFFSIVIEARADNHHPSFIKGSPFTYSPDVVFREGRLVVENGKGKFVYLNKNGKVMFNTAYDYAESFQDGLSIIGLWKTKKDTIQNDTTQVVQMDNMFFGHHSNPDFYGMIDKFGKEVIPMMYEEIGCSSYCRDELTYQKGFIPAQLNGKWGAVNSHNEKLVNFEYERVEMASDVAIIMKEGKYGIVDLFGNILCELKYDKINEYKRGILTAELKGKEFRIDKLGNPME